MATLVLGLRLLLGVVFVTAGVGKLLDLPGSRRAVEEFGVPARAARVVGVLLPLAELTVGVALVFRPSARWAAVAALVLLAAFIVGIVRALSRGDQPDCHCFGQIHSAPAGRATLARNAVLAAMAAVVVAYGSGPAVDTWVSARGAAVLVAIGAGICAIAAAGYALRLWLDNRRLSRDLQLALRSAAIGSRFGLPIGVEAPRFEIGDMGGQRATLNGLLERDRPVLLTFMTPGCGPCATMMPKVQQWQQTLAERLTIAIISTGSAEQNAFLKEEHGLKDVLLQEQMEVGNMYHITHTPTAVLVSSDGKIASVKAETESEIEPLVRTALREGVGSAA